MTWCLYMIRCNNGSLYTGITTDVARRFTDHLEGGAKAAKYLRGKQPLTLVLEQEIGTHSQAQQMEHLIKKLPKQKKEQLVAREINLPCLEEQDQKHIKFKQGPYHATDN